MMFVDHSSFALIGDWLMRSCAISILAVIGMRILSRSGASAARCRFLFAALVILLLLPLFIWTPIARVEVSWVSIDAGDAHPSGGVVIPLLAGVWGVGFGLWGGMLVSGLMQLRRQLANAQSLRGDAAWNRLLMECCTALGLRRLPRLVITNSRAMPCAIGILRPTIVLPDGAQHWDTERRRMVLLHETGHIKRGDLWLQWIALAVRGMYWFNPLVKSLHQSLLVHREEACDALVVAAGARPTIYARHLLEIASTHQHASSLCPALAMASDDHPVGVLEQRIRRLLGGENSGNRARGMPWLVAIVATLWCLLVLGIALIVPATIDHRSDSAPWSSDEIQVRWSADPFPEE